MSVTQCPFFLRWCRPSERALSRAVYLPSPRVHHRSPVVLAVSPPSHSGCVQHIEIRRTWRIQLAKLL